MNNSVAERLFTVAGGLLTGVFIGAVVFGGADWMYDENAPMELTQMVWLAIASCIFALSYKQQSTGVLRWLTLGSVLLSLSFLLRELSLKNIAPDWVVYWTDGTGFRILMLAVWIPWLSRVKKNWSELWQLVHDMLFTRTSFRLVVSAACLIAGGVFDKEIFRPELFRFYEELLELNGYIALTLAAISLPMERARLTRQGRAVSQTPDVINSHYL